jgi:transposase-like protein
MSEFAPSLLDCGVSMSGEFPPGRGSQLTPDERRQIQCFALVDGLSVSQIARETGRDRGTIANVLRAEDSHDFRSQLETEARDAAVQILRGNSEKAARAWGSAIGVAADKGDHRPARDLLVAVGAIQEQNDAPRIAIIIGTPEHPIRVDPPHQVIPRLLNGQPVLDAAGNVVFDVLPSEIADE